MSPISKKPSIDQPIRTESTESVTDWTNRMGAIGFLQIQRHGETQRSDDTLKPRHLLTAVNGYHGIFPKWNTEKLLKFTPKLPTAALTNKEKAKVLRRMYADASL